MKLTAPLVLTAISVFLSTFLATPAIAAPKDTWAILVGGGFAFNSTYASDYRGIKDLKGALLKRQVPENQILTYFAEGCRNGSVRIAAVLKKPCGFFSEAGRDIEKSNERSNVLEGFAKVTQGIPDNGILVVGIATHGEKNGDLNLQNGTKLTLQDLRSVLEPLQVRGVRTILLSSSCYSGNLHRLAEKNTCAFTSTDEKHLTAAFIWTESLLSQMAKRLAKGGDFLAAFETARKLEGKKALRLNTRAMNGMDYKTARMFKSLPTDESPEQLAIWRKKTGYERFDLRFLDTFVPSDDYFEAIECAKTSL